MSLYNLHIKPLVYASAILLPIAYIVGMIFSLKTHAAQINADYMRSLEEANHEGRERERERERKGGGGKRRETERDGRLHLIFNVRFLILGKLKLHFFGKRVPSCNGPCEQPL